MQDILFVTISIAFFGLLIASEMVGPLSSAMTEPRRMSLLRSHSHALSRTGRPRFARKPLGTSSPASGN